MVDKPIAYRRLVDHPVFGIENMKPMVSAVAIATCYQIFVELKHIILQLPLKPLYIRPSPLPASELPPGGEEII